MSDSERPDLAAFRELEQLVQAMADEMATLRRRAQAAEARLRQTELDFAQAHAAAATGAAAPAGAGKRARTDGAATKELERENAELRRRLSAARERTEQLLARLRFLRQQQEQEVGQ
ncbi:MAG TPA: hypothetical protein VFK13_14455 [Gemmatimonadaceae bacterium]|nr:hypothetical protein [Gemmatimonadaceae bacterium]